MLNLRQIEKEVDNAEANIEKELKEKLLNLSKEDFQKYFEKLIDKYYKIVFTFEEDYSKYYDETKEYYKIIKKVKSILASTYNNLNNYENYVRLDKVEDIAYKQMLELNSMEKSYSNIIYHTKTQELIFINETLTDLINLYEEDSSEAVLSLIGNTLKRTVMLMKEAKKLPLYDKEELYTDVTFKREHFNKLSEEEKEEVPEVYETTVLTKPFLSLELKEQLIKFEDILKQLENILPEEVLIEYELNLNSSEKLDFLKFMLEVKSEEEDVEEIYKNVVYIDYLKSKDNKGYLYNIIESWS